MQVVLITGSTRGIGFALAQALLSRGASVVISGCTDASVQSAIGRLSSANDGARVAGRACDVTRTAELEALWNEGARAFGRVDVWINNAGTCNAIKPFVELAPEEIVEVLETNLRGTMLGCRVALERMLGQGHGKLFNMEGWGSRGEISPGMTPYCTSKRALRHFTDSLVRETRGSPVLVGTLSPGMVITDLLVSSYTNGTPENWLRSRRLFNFVIDPPERVCGWLADKVLATSRTGAHHTWMTPLRLLVRFFQPRYWSRNAFAGTALDGIRRES